MQDDDREVRRKLAKLLQVDVDAVAVYEEVLEHVKHEEDRRSFQAFKADHEQHVETLARLLGEREGEDVRAEQDLAGKLAEWVSGARSRLSEEGPLKAMHTAELYHVEKYGEAAGWQLPEDMRTIVESFLDDEHRHLAYTEERLGATTSA